MTKVGFIRTPVNKPTLPESVVTLPNPGELTREPQSRPPMWVWVALFVCAALGLMIILFRSGARTMGMGSLFIMPVMIMSALMMMRNRTSNSNTKPSVIGQTRADYMRKLDELREEVHGGARRQAEEIAYHHPNPAQGALLTLVNTGRMWERSPQDRNFGHVRIGVGGSRLRTKIDPPANVPPPEYRETVTMWPARCICSTRWGGRFSPSLSSGPSCRRCCARWSASCVCGTGLMWCRWRSSPMTAHPGNGRNGCRMCVTAPWWTPPVPPG